MKAIQIVAPRRIDLVELPPPNIRDNEVLVKLIASSICNQMELKAFAGSGGPREGLFPLPPGLPGHEGVGKVIQLGKGVERVKVGDIVVLTGAGGRPPGLHAEYAVRHQQAVVKLAPSLPAEPAAPLELYACVLGGIRKAGGAIGCRVVVSALGPAGLAAVQLLRATGAGEIIGIDPIEERRQRSLLCGADAAYAPNDGRVDSLKREGVGFVFDTSGVPASMVASFEISRDRVVIFGVTEKKFEVDASVWFHNDLTIVAARMLGREGIGNVEAVVRLYERGRIDPTKLITHRMPLGDYAKAMERIESMQALKVLLVHE